MFVAGPRYTEADARRAIAASFSYSDALRRLGMRPVGGNHATLRRYAQSVWFISTAHFDPYRATRLRARSGDRKLPLDEVMVKDSTYDRGKLKQRLYDEKLKRRVCELCGQRDEWRGKRMSLILDHVNGVADDHRLENLRIVCPNCNATLDTHCGRNVAHESKHRSCRRCGRAFVARYGSQRYCSVECGRRWDRASLRGRQPHRWKVPRPPYAELMSDLAAEGWSAVGRKYGVSDNAVRRWVRAYEQERLLEASGRDERDPTSAAQTLAG